MAIGVTTSVTDDVQRDQDLRELIFSVADHPFYNIRWMLALEHRDIISLRSTSGEEAFLSDRVILFYLTYLAALARSKSPNGTVAVISPQFTAFNRSSEEQSARPTMTGASSVFRHMLIPICRNYHCVLAIYDADVADAPIVIYFDPLQRPLTTEIEGVIKRVLATAAEEGPLQASIYDTFPWAFNRQADA